MPSARNAPDPDGTSRQSESQYAREINARKIRAAEKTAAATEKAVRRNEEPFLKPRDREGGRDFYHQGEF